MRHTDPTGIATMLLSGNGPTRSATSTPSWVGRLTIDAIGKVLHADCNASDFPSMRSSLLFASTYLARR